jgi:hypothetical protein
MTDIGIPPKPPGPQPEPNEDPKEPEEIEEAPIEDPMPSSRWAGFVPRRATRAELEEDVAEMRKKIAAEKKIWEKFNGRMF